MAKAVWKVWGSTGVSLPRSFQAGASWLSIVSSAVIAAPVDATKLSSPPSWLALLLAVSHWL
ncbi:hypothetical protein [Sphingomonas melonis]|uniref:hypothetical protein n=1 Tax=Sphingomonas melonis TaxID=152682 RepID=UPI0035C801B0